MRGVVLCLLLASTVARAEPEGYRGGEGRPPVTTYVPPGGGPSLMVRGVTMDGDLVTVTLVISNPTKRPIASALANFDLVYEKDGQGVVEGTYDAPKAGADLGAKQSRTVRERFRVPRGATPTILVYNDDDFPALFALPKARRAAKAGRRI